MDVRERLSAIVAAMPADGSVTLSVATLRGWIEEEPGGAGEGDDLRIDLTVDQVAEKLRRSPSTVRNWLAEHRLPGAYRLRGREWRIPAASLQAFLQQEAEGKRPASPRRRAQPRSRLDDWRAHLVSSRPA